MLTYSLVSIKHLEPHNKHWLHLIRGNDHHRDYGVHVPTLRVIPTERRGIVLLDIVIKMWCYGLDSMDRVQIPSGTIMLMYLHSPNTLPWRGAQF
jgi:hypothetical protein